MTKRVCVVAGATAAALFEARKSSMPESKPNKKVNHGTTACGCTAIRSESCISLAYPIRFNTYRLIGLTVAVTPVRRAHSEQFLLRFNHRLGQLERPEERGELGGSVAYDDVECHHRCKDPEGHEEVEVGKKAERLWSIGSERGEDVVCEGEEGKESK